MDAGKIDLSPLRGWGPPHFFGCSFDLSVGAQATSADTWHLHLSEGKARLVLILTAPVAVTGLTLLV